MNPAVGEVTSAISSMMRAARMGKRGGPELMRLEHVARPELRPTDALVEVHAAAITPTELRWEPTWTTPEGRDRTPVIPGHEVSGVVAALGAEAGDVKVGDEVFGLTDFYRDGAAADYVAIGASDLAHKPPGISHSAAATLPLSGLTAWEGLVRYGKLASGERVLIHGAAGGVGSFAVQLARHFGAVVYATASARDLGFVRSLGAELVVDYGSQRFEDMVGDVGLVFDTVGRDTLERSWQVLGESGRVVTIAPSERDVAARDLRGTFFVVEPDRDALVELGRLAESGDILTVIDRVFPLEAAPEAYAYGLRSPTRGKIVLKLR
jgi:NADPH:quinone reductase-like Zn-dependent oxidoreductase